MASRQFLTIDNFSPGIWDNSRMTGGSLLPAPPGAAQRIGTHRCMSLPGGGLGPLPTPTESFIADVTGTPTNGLFTMTGIQAHGPFVPFNPAFTLHPTVRDVLHYTVEWVDTVGPQRNMHWRRLNGYRDVATSTSILTRLGITTSTSRFYGTSWDVSRIVPWADTVASTSYYPVVVTDWTDWNESTGVFSVVGYQACAPEPGSVVNNFRLIQVGNGQVLAHQNRIIQLKQVAWFGGVDVTQLISLSNELINFTDPPTMSTLGNQSQLFAAENISGYSVWCSIDQQTLLLIKAAGGGVLVSGDIRSPIVQQVPGATSPGQFTMRGVRCPIGIMYVAEDDGAYVFSGGLSQKISHQVDDGSFRRSSPCPTYGTTHHLDAWGQWLMFPNNWLYDTASQSWWQIEDQTVRKHDLWSRSGTRESQMWSAIGNFVDNTVPSIFQWDKNNLATSYAWTSHPLSISIDRQVKVREYEILCNLPQGNHDYTVTITGYSADGTNDTDTQTMRLGAAGLVKIRGSLNVHGYSIVVKVQIASSPADVPACILHSISLGYDEGVKVGAG